MSDDGLVLIGATIVAFIAGYALVLFLVNKMKAAVRSLRLGETQASRAERPRAGPGGGAGDHAHDNAPESQEGDRRDRL
jgi:hypothetical protein